MRREIFRRSKNPLAKPVAVWYNMPDEISEKDGGQGPPRENKPMEERIIPAGGDARLARLEAADRANEYLYHVLDIGQYMLQSGGEVSRVEDSIRRLCLAFGAERADVFTITSSIVVTIYSPSFGAVTQTRRVTGQQYDLNRLEKLNQLSRRICAEHLSLEETRRALEEIRRRPSTVSASSSSPTP